jgi:hypothetical protein
MTTPNSTNRRLSMSGWILTALLTAFMLFSATGKFIDFEGKEKLFQDMGWKLASVQNIGIVEVIIVLMFLIPRASFVAAILISAYLGGAVAIHVRVDEPFVFPIILGVLYWIALGLRDRRVFVLAFQKQSL